jgi:hypothetical protein
VIYDRYSTAPRAWELSPITDQQLGGAIMLAEGAAVTIAVFAWLVLRSFAEPSRPSRPPPPFGQHPCARSATPPRTRAFVAKRTTTGTTHTSTRNAHSCAV